MKKLTIATLLAVASLATTSCKDFLTEKPVDSVSPAQVTDANSYVNGALNTLSAEAMFRYGQFPNLWDYDSDDSTGPSWAFGDVGSGNFQSYWGIDAGWNGPYILIHRCNFALAQVGGMTSMDPVAQKNALAQLHFLRGWAYYLLVRAYGPVPLFEKSIVEGTAPQQARTPVKDIYAFIINELKMAETDLYTSRDANYIAGHPSKGAASSLLAKTYLTMASGSLASGQVTVMGGPALRVSGTKRFLLDAKPLTHTKAVVAGLEGLNSAEYFKLARDKAQEVMNSGDYQLFGSHAQTWSVTNQNKGEHIWSLQTVSNDPLYGNEVSWFHVGRIVPATGEIDGGAIAISNHWYNLLEPKDQRITDGVVHRWKVYGGVHYYPTSDSLVVRGTDMSPEAVAKRAKYGYLPTDYSNVDDTHICRLRKFEAVSDRGAVRGNFNYPLLRYPDVMLIFAEADNEANSGPTAAAREAVNLIRRRNGASDMPATLNQQAFRSYVLEERRRELALEGDRRWDLLRWGIYLPVMNAIDIDENNVVKRRSSKNLLYPIPMSELNSNRLITGNNPGW